MQRAMLSLALFVTAVGFFTPSLHAQSAADVSRVLESGKAPADKRLGPPRTLNDAYHPWEPPATMAAWEKEREAIRDRILVGLGLWPMPPAIPLKPVVHGKIDRDGYTIEKVFFASHPGHYVTGNLYRPKNISGKAPGVLCPHGHWANGRFYEISQQNAQKQQIDVGAEKFMAGARYPLQARMVHLARMGCVVFHYDMVGNADSTAIPHRAGFTDLQAQLRSQDFMGLQTWNSIRALDFILSLPDVDATRIGVTGASGGGTQTFMLCALDPRPTVAFPAVMVSTAMQGGCVCENCSYLRIGINNIAITALTAPRPLAMSGAEDWTKEIETKGLPELKKVYSLYGKPEFVHAKQYLEFGHNYNQVAREMMYAWFNKHLKLELPEPIPEREFWPVPPAELSVFDKEHPQPADAAPAEKLREYLTRVSDEQFQTLLPKDAAGLNEYRRVVGTAARVMLDTGVPEPDDIERVTEPVETDHDGYRLYKVSITRKGAGEQIPIVALLPANFNGTLVLWFDGAGKKHLFDADGKINAAVKSILATGRAVASADVFMTGELIPAGASTAPPPKVNEGFPGYTFGYNRPWLSNRVRDVLTVIGGARRQRTVETIHLVGTGDAGVWTLLARAVAGDKVKSCVADLQGFGFSKIKTVNDPNMLPASLKYGGLGGLAALAAPAEITLTGTKDVPATELTPLEAAYKASGGKLNLQADSLAREKVAALISP